MWAVSGVYQVLPTDQVLITSFGKVDAAIKPGWHWYPRFLADKYSFDTTEIQLMSFKLPLISQDQAVLSSNITVRYKVTNAKQYVFAANDIPAILQNLIQAKMTLLAGNTNFGQLLANNATIAQSLMTQAQASINQLQLGITLSEMDIDNIKVPAKVEPVLDNLQNAAKANQAAIAQAKAQAQGQLESAQDQAAQMIADAKANSAQAVPQAKQDVAGFMAIWPQYQKNPQAVRDNLYFNTMQKIAASAKVIVVNKAGLEPIPTSVLPAGTQMPQPINVVSSSSSDKDKMTAYVRWMEAQYHGN
jgi:membrane protease subunit HflK